MNYNEHLEVKTELTKLINKFSLESKSNTPDYILADYLLDCLNSFNLTVKCRESWYGRSNEAP